MDCDKFIKVSNDLVRSKELSMHEKAILMVLISDIKYNPSKTYRLPHYTMAKYGRMSRRQVIRVQKGLTDKGYINVFRDPLYRTNIYHLTEKTLKEIVL